jgi:hypothetical protein
MTGGQLASGLLQAVRAQDFGATPDRDHGGQPVTHFPSIDLAVVAFPRGAAPVAANVLFSREHPQGWVAGIGPGFGPVQDICFLRDQRDASLESPAWKPHADWQALHFEHLWGPAASHAAPARFVAPYPASLLKVMVAVGVGMAVDRGLTPWPAAVAPMITVSSNEATDEMVALLHRLGMVESLQARLAACGLHTLRLENTTPDGGWRNANGAGVGAIHMTAWDSVRLMWLLDEAAPPAPWLPAGVELLSPASRTQLRCHLQSQELHEILSSHLHRARSGWVPGIPATLSFAHKTGTTDNYASDAGIVHGQGPERRHYLVALLTTLGRRYAPHPECATTWRLPALGAAIDALLAPWLEDREKHAE